MGCDMSLIANGELSALLPRVQDVARDAGALIMRFYEAAGKKPGGLSITAKADGSPVTQADHESSGLIEMQLAALTPGIAVVSEENATMVGPDDVYWTVDPLDGTKEFINRTDGFAVKIALMDRGVPALGVVYAPAQISLYSGLRDGLATRQTGSNEPKALSTRREWPWDLRVLFNAAHGDMAVYDGVERERFAANGVAIPGSPDIHPGLPRNLRVAEGLADFHVAAGGNGETGSRGGYIWDNAADWLILKNAGGEMRELSGGAPVTFGEPRHPMPPYIAVGDKNLGKKLFPEI